MDATWAQRLRDCVTASGGVDVIDGTLLLEIASAVEEMQTVLRDVSRWIDTAEFDDGSEQNCPVHAIAPFRLADRVRKAAYSRSDGTSTAQSAPTGAADAE